MFTCTREGCYKKDNLIKCIQCKWQLYCCEEHRLDDIAMHKEHCLIPALSPNWKVKEPSSLSQAQDMYYDACEYYEYCDNDPRIWLQIKEDMEEAIRISPKCCDAWGMLASYYIDGPNKNLIKALECCESGLSQGLWYNNQIENRSISYDHIENRGYLRLYYPKFTALYQLKRYQEASETLKHYHRIGHRSDLVIRSINVFFLISSSSSSSSSSTTTTTTSSSTTSSSSSQNYNQIRYLINTYKEKELMNYSKLLYNFCMFSGYGSGGSNDGSDGSNDNGMIVTMNDLGSIFADCVIENDLIPYHLLNPTPIDYKRKDDLDPRDVTVMSQYYVEEECGRDAWLAVPGAMALMTRFYDNRNASLPSETVLLYLLKQDCYIRIITSSSSSSSSSLVTLLCSKKKENVFGWGRDDFQFGKGFFDDTHDHASGTTTICVYDKITDRFKDIKYSDIVEVPYWNIYYNKYNETNNDNDNDNDNDPNPNIDPKILKRKEKNKRKKLKQKIIAAAKKPDTIKAREEIMRSGNLLDTIFSYLIGIYCDTNHILVSKQLVTLYLVSSSFRIKLLQTSSLRSLVFSEKDCRLSVCGYGNGMEKDKKYDKYSSDMLLAFTKYSGKFLMDLYLSVRVLRDEVLVTIGNECKNLKRFRLGYSEQQGENRYMFKFGDVPSHRCFSKNALVEFFSKSSLLTHVHFFEVVCSSKDINMVEHNDVITALSRHPLVSISLNVCDLNCFSIFDLIASKYMELESMSLSFNDRNVKNTLALSSLMESLADTYGRNAASPTSLKSLSLYGTVNRDDKSFCYVNDSMLKRILPSVPSLRSLSLITLHGFRSVAKSGITTVTLDLISQHCPSLTYLDLSGHGALTAEGISKVLDCCNNLIYLNICQTSVKLESIQFQKPLSLVFFWYSLGDQCVLPERQRIQKYIDEHPQTLFLEEYLGLINDKESTHPLTKLSYEYSTKMFEFSEGFKRGVTSAILTSDDYVANFRSKQIEIISTTK